MNAPTSPAARVAANAPERGAPPTDLLGYAAELLNTAERAKLQSLRDLLEARAHVEADPRVTDLAAEGGRPAQAGPNPGGQMPPFVPGNVVPMEAYIREAAAARKRSTSQ